MFKKDLGLLVLILVLGTVVALINQRFLLPGNLSNTANQIGLFGLFSIGEAFVIVTGGIDLSVGSLIALLGTVFIDLIVNHNLNWVLAIVAIVAGGCALGALHGLLVTRMRLQPFVVTLCGLLIYRGVARYYTQDATAGFGFGVSFPTLEWLTAGRSEMLAPFARLVGYHGATIAIPHSLVALIVVALAAGVVLHRSIFGRYLFAIGKNEEAARYSGINSDRIVVSAYIVCSGWRRSPPYSSPCTPGRFRRRCMAASMNSTRSPPLFWVAVRYEGAKGRSSGRARYDPSANAAEPRQPSRHPVLIDFAVMGTVILVGVIADQRLLRFRGRAAAERGRANSASSAAKLGASVRGGQ